MCCSVCCSVLHCVAVRCSVLLCVAVCCSVLQCVAVCCSALQCVALCCFVLQCVAVCCSVLQCVAVCCSVLQSLNMSNARNPHLTPLRMHTHTSVFFLFSLLRHAPNPRRTHTCKHKRKTTACTLSQNFAHTHVCFFFLSYFLL